MTTKLCARVNFRRKFVIVRSPNLRFCSIVHSLSFLRLVSGFIHQKKSRKLFASVFSRLGILAFKMKSFLLVFFETIRLSKNISAQTGTKPAQTETLTFARNPFGIVSKKPAAVSNRRKIIFSLWTWTEAKLGKQISETWKLLQVE